MIAQLQDELTQTRAALERLNAQTENPSVRLHRLIENFAVFFTKQDNLADPAAAVAGLDELAKLLVSAGEGLRVVGYSDESGSAITNSAVSRARADKVISMLVERGVPREKLALVPRSTLAPIADLSLGVGRSRRVVFEQPYDHEFDIR